MDELKKTKLIVNIGILNSRRQLINSLKSKLGKSAIFNVAGPIVSIPELLAIGNLLEEQDKFNEQLCDLLETLINAS